MTFFIVEIWTIFIIFNKENRLQAVINVRGEVFYFIEFKKYLIKIEYFETIISFLFTTFSF